MTVLPISHRATLDASTYLKTQSVFVQYSPVAARGCLPPGSNVFVAALTPAIRSPVDILMVITMASVWTVNSKLSWGCNYVMQWNLGWLVATAKKCKRQFARTGQISEFHILPLQMPPPPAQCRPGQMPPSLPHPAVLSLLSRCTVSRWKQRSRRFLYV